MKLPRFLRRRHWDQERAREIEAYLQHETDQNIARGMPADEARYAALRKLGNPISIREEIYRMNTLGMLDAFWQDLRHAARLLRLSPGFTFVAVASLALGIGANTAIFQLVDAIRLRTLPVQNPQQLAEIHIANRDWGTGRFSGPHPALTNPLWEQVRDHQQAFSGIFAWTLTTFNLATAGQVRSAEGLWASGDIFNVLGVQPILGRVFSAADDRRGCSSPGVVISYAFWQREFAGDPAAVGKPLSLDGHPFEIIGVTPAGFFGIEVGKTFDVALPLCTEPIFAAGHSALDHRDEWWLAGMGRLKPGWSLGQATAHLKTISPALFEATLPSGYGKDLKDYLTLQLGAFPAGTGMSNLRDNYSRPLWFLMATAGLVLLIACANLANLMLARANTRSREIAVRLAIGASRSRLIAQLLAESLFLAILGATLGALLAQSLSRILVALIGTEGNPLFVNLATDWRVLAFTAALAIATCLIFGLAPALRASHTEPGTVIKSGGRGMTVSRERFGLRRILVVSQVALSLVLLVASLLFVRTLRNLLTLDTGFQRDGILIAYLDLRGVNAPKGHNLALKEELVTRIEAVPGVQSATQTSLVPLSGSSWTLNVEMTGPDPAKGASRFAWVSPSYFKTMNMPILGGRVFDANDKLASPRAVIVNERFAQRLHGANPIGKTFRTIAEPGYPEAVYEIVGLVRDSKFQSLREAPQPIAFALASQHPARADWPGTQLVIRLTLPPSAVIPAMKRAISEVSPQIAEDFEVFQTMVENRLTQERVMATLSGFFGFLAAILAAIGLYGVMSYMVTRRRNEIAIRMALGAARRDVTRMILREAGMLLAIGLAIGSALALAASTTAGKMLFGLTAHDPLTLAAAAASLTIIALAASYLPALRASRLDPMIALRDE